MTVRCTHRQKPPLRVEDDDRDRTRGREPRDRLVNGVDKGGADPESARLAAHREAPEVPVVASVGDDPNGAESLVGRGVSVAALPLLPGRGTPGSDLVDPAGEEMDDGGILVARIDLEDEGDALLADEDLVADRDAREAVGVGRRELDADRARDEERRGGRPWGGQGAHAGSRRRSRARWRSAG